MKDFELLIYNTPTEDVKVSVVLKNERIWATQKAMATLFGVTVASISRHISNIFVIFAIFGSERVGNGFIRPWRHSGLFLRPLSFQEENRPPFQLLDCSGRGRQLTNN